MKFIIGGGISGLIFSFFNPEYKIISSNVGGQMTNKISFGPRILQENPYNKYLLECLKINAVVKTMKIGYFYNGSLHDRCPLSLKELYYTKSRNIISADEKIPESIMSEGKNTIDYYDVDFKQIVKALYEKVSFIKSNVLKINDGKIFLDDLKTFIEYKHIISTIQAPAFFRMFSKPKFMYVCKNLKYLSKEFIIVPSAEIDIGSYDYVYFPEMKYNFHRVTKFNSSFNNSMNIVEYVNSIYSSGYNKVNTKKEWKRIIARDYMEIGQIQSGEIPTIPAVMFLGRYAEWNHSIKTQDVVKKSIEFGGVN